MKKCLAILLGLCMCLSAFAFVGCEKEKIDTKAYNGNYQAATEADLATLGEKFSTASQEFTTVDDAGNVSKIFAGFESYLVANTSVKYGNDNSLTEKFDFLGQVSASQDANGSKTILHGKTNLSVDGKGDMFKDVVGEKSISASGEAYLYAIKSRNEDKAGMLMSGNMHLSDELDFSGKFKYEQNNIFTLMNTLVPGDFDESLIGEEVPDIAELFTAENIAMVQQYADISVDFSNGTKIKLSLKQSVVNELVAQYANVPGAADMNLNVEVSKADIYIVLNSDGTFHGIKVDFVVSASANVPDYSNPTSLTMVPVEVKFEFQFVFNKLMEEITLPEDTSSYVDITDQINAELDDIDLAGLTRNAGAIGGGMNIGGAGNLNFDFDNLDFDFSGTGIIRIGEDD